LYGTKLVEIDKELLLLNKEVVDLKGERLNKVTKVIENLKIERESCYKKIYGSKNRLISVRNNLSEEMLSIVNKDIFSTEKHNFYNENVHIPITDRVPDGLVYKLQIGFFKHELNPEHFEGIFPLSSQKVDEIYYRYVAGNFATYEDAKDAKVAAVNKGYVDSFVVAYFDGEKISISEALQAEKEE